MLRTGELRSFLELSHFTVSELEGGGWEARHPNQALAVLRVECERDATPEELEEAVRRILSLARAPSTRPVLPQSPSRPSAIARLVAPLLAALVTATLLVSAQCAAEYDEKRSSRRALTPVGTQPPRSRAPEAPGESVQRHLQVQFDGSFERKEVPENSTCCGRCNE